jgi:hypothetical protein
MSEYTQGKTIKDLERAYSNYTHEMASALSSVNDKKKASLKYKSSSKSKDQRSRKCLQEQKKVRNKKMTFLLSFPKQLY